jgi:S-formylglutathione hydrolase
MAAPTEVSSSKMFGGFNKRYKHDSAVLGCSMNFTIYFPLRASSTQVPILYWLSGLTCTDENFITKSGGQRAAAEQGVALICPDTSPRGLNVEGQADNWDFGVGAGFYVNATQEKWKNWQMYDYITKELPALLKSHFKQLDTSRSSIAGHSMGGHGALIIVLKNPGTYKSVSAFAPVANPSPTLWGIKAFSGYLGEDKSAWKAYDATELVKDYKGPILEILIDQGDKDQFYLEKRLLPETFKDAAEDAGVQVTLRLQNGYDHSYYFIATFIDDHIKYHAKALYG